MKLSRISLYKEVRYLGIPKMWTDIINKITFLDLIVNFFFQQTGTPGGFSITNQDCTTKVSTYLKIGYALCYIMLALRQSNVLILLLYHVLISQYLTIIGYRVVVDRLFLLPCSFLVRRSAVFTEGFLSLHLFLQTNDGMRPQNRRLLLSSFFPFHYSLSSSHGTLYNVRSSERVSKTNFSLISLFWKIKSRLMRVPCCLCAPPVTTDGTPVGYSLRAALRREQCDMTPESWNSRARRDGRC
jgi:hypothetical protein